MKKIACLLFLFLFIGTIGCESKHYYIVGISIVPVIRYNSGAYSQVPESELWDEIIFAIDIADSERITTINNCVNTNAGSRCYAFTSPPPVYDNRLLEETFSMTFDRPFVYAGDIIEAGVDILKEQSFEDEIFILRAIDVYYLHYMEFSDTFSENALFEDEYYTVTFSCKTSDNRDLRTETVVKFPQRAVMP